MTRYGPARDCRARLSIGTAGFCGDDGEPSASRFESAFPVSVTAPRRPALLRGKRRLVPQAIVASCRAADSSPASAWDPQYLDRFIGVAVGG
jgi:hypothetical protein